MSRYLFKLKKNNIEIELSSTDANFIARQMEYWQGSLLPDLMSAPSVKKPEPAPEFIPEDDLIMLQPKEDKFIIDETISEIEIEDQEPEEVVSAFVADEDIISELDQTLEESMEVIDQVVSSIDDVKEDYTVSISEEVDISEYTTETEYDIEEPEPEIEEQDYDYSELLKQYESEEAEEDKDIRVTNSSESEDDVEVEVMSDMSSLLAAFEEESKVDIELEDETYTENETLESYAIDQTEEYTEIAKEQGLVEDFETVEEVTINYKEDIPEESPAEEDDLDALLAAMEAEVDKETNEPEPAPLTETLVQETIIPDHVKQIKEEMKAKKEKLVYTLENFVSSLKVKTPVDLLLATAFYMEKYESFGKFTTKDISNRTFKAFKKPVSPNIVLAAVNKGYIEVVPDFTGTAESNEYALTDLGKDFIANELS